MNLCSEYRVVLKVWLRLMFYEYSQQKQKKTRGKKEVGKKENWTDVYDYI